MTVSASERQQRTSAILEDFITDRATAEEVSFAEIRDALAGRTYGALMLLFSLPNLIPSGIPGLSTVLGLPILLLSLQLIAAVQRPWLPAALLRRTIPRQRLKQVLDACLPTMRRVERLLRPRWLPLTGWLGVRLLALVCFVLAIVLILPIPFGNWPPALAIAFLSLALIERDGLACAVGLVAAIASLIAVGKLALTLVLALIAAGRAVLG